MFYMPKRLKLADENVLNLHVMKANEALSLEAMWRCSLPGDISSGTLQTRTSSISDKTLTYLWRSCLPPCVAVTLRLQALAHRSRWWAACKILKRGSGLRYLQKESCSPWCWQESWSWAYLNNSWLWLRVRSATSVKLEIVLCWLNFKGKKKAMIYSWMCESYFHHLHFVPLVCNVGDCHY